jgi:hypothetical protein
VSSVPRQLMTGEWLAGVMLIEAIVLNSVVCHCATTK